MQNMHRQYIIRKLLRVGGSISPAFFFEEDVKQLLLMISNVHDDHEVQQEDIKLPLSYKDGKFILETTECWNGCGSLTVAADHPTYCEECEEACKIASVAHELERPVSLEAEFHQFADEEEEKQRVLDEEYDQALEQFER
jgi:hypothetical protein